MMPWEVESIQFAIFTPSPSKRPADALWRATFKKPIDAFNTLAVDWTVAGGEIGQDRADLQVQPTRIDLTYSGTAPLSTTLPLSLLSLNDQRAALKNGIIRIGQISSNIAVTRAALIVQRFFKTTTVTESIDEIVKRVPAILRDSRAEDLNYQVNIKLDSSNITGLSYHRLCRWFSGQKIRVQGPVAPGMMFSGAATNAAVEMFDLSTSPVSTLKNSDLKKIFLELADIYYDLEARGYNAL